MKKYTFLYILLIFASVIFAQQKYALVIGNEAYSGISVLNNPVNDANSMETTLIELGFSVSKVLDGNLEQMESAIENYKTELSASRNTYGFFFYAGHGVQSSGLNYLIPINASNILNDTHLRERTVSLQLVIDNLTEAKNDLNLIVLDACRDNPFSWSRSGFRGLSTVTHSPPGSIIMYATAAGQSASDGPGLKNGIFTSHLLNNLKTPGLEITEVFRRTMGDVERSTGNQQRPAIFNQFSGLAYLGSRPSPVPTPPPINPIPPNPLPLVSIFSGKWSTDILHNGIIDNYVITFIGSNHCNIKVTSLINGREVSEDVNGTFLYDNDILRISAIIRNSKIPHINEIQWASVISIGTGNNLFNMLVNPSSTSNKQVRATFIKNVF